MNEPLTERELKQLQKAIGYTGILCAVAAWEEGTRPKNMNFRKANGWEFMIAKRRYAHRQIMAIAAELQGLPFELSPQSFGGENDNICKDWMTKKLRFTVKKVQK